MKNIMNKVPENFEELLGSISSIVSFCKYAKILEKQEDRCEIFFNVDKINGVAKNMIKSLRIRNDFYNDKNIVVVFLEDCIAYSQVVELNVKQAFYLCLSLLEE